MNKISIIVPCFNEEEVLPDFYQETRKVVNTISDASYEFVFIDDGSRDHTLDILRLLSYQDAHCKYISFSRNFGKEAAMYAGLTEATGDYCVLMDADLQHPPKLLPDMYHAVSQEGYDCCAGKRVGREGDGVLRSFLSKSFYRVIQKLTHMNMSDGAGDFRMMNRKMTNAILEMKEYNRYTKGIFSFVGFETKWLEFHNVERAAGKTKWNIKSLFSYAFDGILSFSTAPLKLSGILGLLFLLISACLGVTAIFHPRTWLIVTAIVVFLSSLQMLMVFILGEYLSKDYLENKKRPIYIVREESSSN
ncbi:glycosyltransferase family 2 protein [Roseburia sp. MSJ-14]|uniref:glycosyltransferase family 2 protein n=1 Tax=Roseburia sp. MSJ-14 TaxID=2841514 RepID=UPI001C125C4E|nr:glycosyltransferase family 2 protein [Roseburia sp. MSJ-14]MBU5475042.1 glycosyltransferase family 2 protein [Roseburia sp. MSJ-14]